MKSKYLWFAAIFYLQLVGGMPSYAAEKTLNCRLTQVFNSSTGQTQPYDQTEGFVFDDVANTVKHIGGDERPAAATVNNYSINWQHLMPDGSLGNFSVNRITGAITLVMVVGQTGHTMRGTGTCVLQANKQAF